MILPVNLNQKRYAFKLTHEVYSDKRANGFKDLCFSKKHPMKIEYEGFLGEIIMADFFGLPRPKLIKGRVDSGKDLTYSGKNLEVKTYRPFNGQTIKEPDFILEPKALEKTPDAFVFVVLDSSAWKAEVKAIGFHEFVEKAQEKDYGYGKRLFIPFYELRELKEVV